MPQNNSSVPENSTIAAGLAGAITTIIIFAMEQLGIEANPAVAAAFTTVIMFIINYVVPDRKPN